MVKWIIVLLFFSACTNTNNQEAQTESKELALLLEDPAQTVLESKIIEKIDLEVSAEIDTLLKFDDFIVAASTFNTLPDFTWADSCNCNFETYLDYEDSLALYTAPNTDPVRYFRFEDDPEYDFGGTFNYTCSTSGWMQIENKEHYQDLNGLWVRSTNIKTGIRNYQKGVWIALFAEPSFNSDTIDYYKIGEPWIVKCAGDWVYIKTRKNAGWLHKQLTCPSDLTNCN